MRVVALLSAALIMAACSDQPPKEPSPLAVQQAPQQVPQAPASAEERDASAKAYQTCLRDAARRLDDGISDAATIAAAIAPTCRSLYVAMADTQVRGEELSVQGLMRQKLVHEEIGRITPVVLQVRAERKKVSL